MHRKKSKGTGFGLLVIGESFQHNRFGSLPSTFPSILHQLANLSSYLKGKYNFPVDSLISIWLYYFLPFVFDGEKTDKLRS